MDLTHFARTVIEHACLQGRAREPGYSLIFQSQHTLPGMEHKIKDNRTVKACLHRQGDKFQKDP